MEAKATKKDAHEALVQITEKWDAWTSSQKKRLVQAWIKELHLFTQKQKSGAWIKGIVFQFPVVVFGQVSDAFNFPADADDPDESFQQQETTDDIFWPLPARPARIEYDRHNFRQRKLLA